MPLPTTPSAPSGRRSAACGASGRERERSARVRRGLRGRSVTVLAASGATLTLASMLVMHITHEKGELDAPRKPSAQQPARPGVGGASIAGSRVVSASDDTPTGEGGVARLAGRDRVGTALAVATDRFPDGEDAAVLATDDDFADALAGTALASRHDAPLLLNPKAELDQRVAEHLHEALPPGGTVYVLGGEDALSTQVSDAIIGLGLVVTRVAGPDRYATSAAVAGEVLREATAGCRVVLATGTAFPDGASASGLVDAERPLLYSRGAVLPEASRSVLDRCSTSSAGLEVTAVGRDAAAAVDALHADSDHRITKVTGTNTYDTSASVASIVAASAPADASDSTGRADGTSAPAATAPGSTPPSPAATSPSGGASAPGGAGAAVERRAEEAAAAASELGSEEGLEDDAHENDDAGPTASGHATQTAAELAVERRAEAVNQSASPGGVGVVLASGDDYADALVAGTYGAPVLLVPAGQLPQTSERVLSELATAGRATPGSLLVIGGEDAVGPDVTSAARAALSSTTPGRPAEKAQGSDAPADTPSQSTSPSAPAPSASRAGGSPETPGSPSSTAAPAPATAAARAASGGRAGVPNISGLAWNSGVYVPGSKASNQKAFGDWRGAAADVAVDWAPRGSWNDIVSPGWLYDAWRGKGITTVFGVAMIPEDGSGSISACAAGAYDDKWKQFGTNIKNAGLADTSIIRLGWEFNGDWYAWKASDPAAWAQCWRKVHTAAESTAPGLRWDWSVNRGEGQSVKDPTRAYPGDAYVDIIGVDSYDGWPAATNEDGWKQQYEGAFGLRFWKDFATAHGKAMSVPEWGVYPGTAWAGHNGGDNAFYIQKMNGFFKEVAPMLAYEAYFNEDAGYYAGSLFGPTQNPKAAAAYAQLW